MSGTTVSLVLRGRFESIRRGELDRLGRETFRELTVVRLFAL